MNVLLLSSPVNKDIRKIQQMNAGRSKGYPHSMMILAYFRTKLCSLKTNRDRLLVPSTRSRLTNRFQRPWLGRAATAGTPRDDAVGGPPASADLAPETTTPPPWQTPAVAIVDDLTTTSIASQSAAGATTVTAVWIWVYFATGRAATRTRIVTTVAPRS